MLRLDRLVPACAKQTGAELTGNPILTVENSHEAASSEQFRRFGRHAGAVCQSLFGPVRSVRPELVFEIAFEGIQASARHNSGVAVRFPRILRWRRDKKIADADSIETLKALLPEPS